jgi:hypothetical protein
LTESHSPAAEETAALDPKLAALDPAAAASRLGIRIDEGTAVFDVKSLLNSLGGWWGIIESTIPPTAFLAVYSITLNVLWAVAIAGSLSAISLVKQLITRKALTQAIAGAALIAISAWLALRGQPKDYYITGFFTNGIYGSVLFISILARWPVIGLLVGFLKGWGVKWRKDRALLTRFDLVTGLWVGLFATRLIIELPMYFANNLQLLGITKLILSEPAYAIVLWFSWLSLRSVILAKS